MTSIEITPQLANKLNRLAEREHKTVAEVLEKLLEDEVAPTSLSDKPRPGSGAALLKSALEADIHAGDLAGKSREILEKDFPKYLRGRVEDQSTEG